MFTLMKEDYIILPFSVPEPVQFKLGDYVDLAGVLDESLGGKLAKIYEITDIQKPTYNTSTGGYDYELQMNAYYWKWKNKIFKYTPEQAGSEASWALTAALDVQLGVFLRNLKALGYTYRGTDFTFSIDSTVENKAVAMTYDNMNLLDALFSMAGEDKWNCDCWITDNVIHFGRCEFGDAVKIERGVEASSVTRSESQGTYATRIYAFGSTKNIPTNYRPTDEQAVINGVVQKRLMLPADTPYIDAYEGMSQEEAIEDVVVFDDVYPRRVGTLSDVHTRTEEVENEDGTTETVTYYRYKDTGLEFKEEYIIEGQELKIRFQSGKLNGMEFGVIFNPTPNDETRGEQLWEIVRNEDYGRPLPDNMMYPANGDEYILSGFDIQLVSDQYIPAAEQELKEKAQKYADKVKKDDGTYPTTLASNWVHEDPISRTFEFGQRINLVDDTYFENGRISRVLGWEMNLDIPWDSPVYTIGESMPYSRIGEIEGKVDSLTYKGQTYTGGGGSGVYIITTNDSTAPSDSNVFSALRSLATFLRKDQPDSTKYLIRFLGGLISDNIESQDFASGPFGTGFIVKRDPKTGKSYIETDELYVRLKAYFDTLEIKHLSHVGGRIVLSPASMECNRVEKVSGESETLFDSIGSQLYDSSGSPLEAMVEGQANVYRCYFNNTDGEKDIVNEFSIDDLAQCREFNVKENISHNVSNQYYWRRVVGLGDNYIDLSISDCDTGSMEPKAGDTIVTVGNKSDENRQHVVYLSSYDEDAPCFKLYSGINDYSMLNKEITVISPNADKNVFTGKVVIKSGSTGFENFEDAPDFKQLEEDVANAKNDANEAKSNVESLKGYVDGAFADGIITKSEAKAISTYINTVESTYNSAYSSYNELYNNEYLEGDAKTGLKQSFDNFVTYKDSLVDSINNAISDGKTDSSEKAQVDSAYANFNTAYGQLITAIETANKAIQDKLKDYSEMAKQLAEEANQAAQSAQTSADEAKSAVSSLNTYIDGAFSDGIISEAEAKSIEKYINTVNQTKDESDATYDTLYTNTYLTGSAKTALYNAKSNFDSATSSLISAINSAIADGKTTESEKANVDSKFDSFNSYYAALSTAIQNANKAIQDRIKGLAAEQATNDALQAIEGQIQEVTDAAKDDIAKQMGYTDYAQMQQAATRGETLIDGGMINTTLIEVKAIVTSALIASAIKTSTLNVNDNFIVDTNGNVSIAGDAVIEGNSVFRGMIETTFVKLKESDANLQSSGRYRINSNLNISDEGGSVIELPISLSYKSKRITIVNTVTQYSRNYADSYTQIRSQQDQYIYGGPLSEDSVIANRRVVCIKLLTGVIELVAIPQGTNNYVSWFITNISAALSESEVGDSGEVTTYTISTSVSPSGAGTVTGGGENVKDYVGSLTASANVNYKFREWSDGQTINPISVVWDSNKSYVAYFDKIEITGENLFEGADLTDSSYWESEGGVLIFSVSNGLAWIGYPSDGLPLAIFNRGYLSGKIKTGHKYELSIIVKSLKEDTSIMSNIDYKSGTGGDPISGESVIMSSGYNVDKVGKKYTTLKSTFTAVRESTSQDYLWIFATLGTSIYISEISLKEVE